MRATAAVPGRARILAVSCLLVGSFNLAVMTYEKLMSLLAQQPGLLGRCTTVVVDEVQSLSDAERGARLEVLLTQIMLDELYVHPA